MNGYNSELKSESVVCEWISEEKTTTICAKIINNFILLFNTKRYCFLVQLYDFINSSE
jgi:hypothetical protein